MSATALHTAARLTERRLGPQDLRRVVEAHDALHRNAAVPGLFVRETPAFFARHLGPDGEITALETPAGRLAAYAVLGLPEATDEENFGHALELDEAERALVCHVDGMGVLPAWRGLGLHRRMTRLRLARAAEAGRSIALSTAAPHNIWSIANLTAEGMRVVRLVGKYGALRLILRAEIGLPGRNAETPPPDAPVIPLDGDVDGHRACLAQGLEGVAVRWTGDVAGLVYASPRAGAAQ